MLPVWIKDFLTFGSSLKNRAIVDGSMVTFLPSGESKKYRFLNGNVIAFDTANKSFELS